ncbi:hypothetical protein [Novipirellula caenicola]|uniref:hypothetical protein n=1 Tax=Novipirellula caenicola TaxID=1536901 RepID=UPI0031F155A0
MTILLVVDSSDPASSALVERLCDVAASFRTGIGFGWITKSNDFKHPSIQPDDLAVTPVVLMFRGGKLLFNDATGRRQIELALSNENINAMFGYTIGGARLVE